MKKIGLSLVVILTFLGYILTNRKSEQSSQTQSDAASRIVPTSGPSQNSTQPIGSFTDGEYTGSDEDAFYGRIQVKAVISGGRIADIQFLRYPDDRRDSIEINQTAMPILEQEAIQAQSSQVDVVSGATDSSLAFNKSLATALSQAQ